MWFHGSSLRERSREGLWKDAYLLLALLRHVALCHEELAPDLLPLVEGGVCGVGEEGDIVVHLHRLVAHLHLPYREGRSGGEAG